jgi:predicted DNA-binding transcriptional regulator AlpA
MSAVAKIIGVSLSHLHTMRRKKLLGPQPVKLGGTIRWKRSELLRWIQAECPDLETWNRIKIQVVEVNHEW